MEKYEVVKDIGAGYIELGGLMRVKNSKELVAMKFIERGSKARYLFQQLISAVSYCHATVRQQKDIEFVSLSQKMCHRELKLEDTFLDGSPEPCLKICDFGYSKSVMRCIQAVQARKLEPLLISHLRSLLAASMMARQAYLCPPPRRMADIWSCGVILYVMLVGARPFEDENDHRNFGKTMQNIKDVQYKIPDDVHISQDCIHLLSLIFIATPVERISIANIKKHGFGRGEKRIGAER
ncbi:hypothetical protein F2Q69_00026318 [Brassica cretica]|uniref:non-specific serine/threonine protein kinase n=1 Tax=Brassica cretica TaxID=69181 RepID=A0A8S9S2L3_BRACR|nr:hypothetical protein F2Q69_00026318 [Brassica cretica]